MIYSNNWFQCLFTGSNIILLWRQKFIDTSWVKWVWQKRSKCFSMSFSSMMSSARENSLQFKYRFFMETFEWEALACLRYFYLNLYKISSWTVLMYTYRFQGQHYKMCFLCIYDYICKFSLYIYSFMIRSCLTIQLAKLWNVFLVYLWYLKISVYIHRFLIGFCLTTQFYLKCRLTL